MKGPTDLALDKALKLTEKIDEFIREFEKEERLFKIAEANMVIKFPAVGELNFKFIREKQM